MSKLKPTNKQLIKMNMDLQNRNEILIGLLCKRAGGQTEVTQEELDTLLGYRIFTSQLGDKTLFKIEKEK